MFVPLRTPKPHEAIDADWSNREGALTNGELSSSDAGLLGYFKRVHRQEFAEPNPKMDCAAAAAIKQLKAQRNHTRDTFLWLALAERLASKGYPARWMLDYFTPRCPLCGSIAKFPGGKFGSEAICASAEQDHGAVDDAIREKITEFYENAFDDDLEPAVV
ncbi:hypothetical protein [Halopelagius fulvigenes]|uniref:Uncharacterized protein n=1 Tax=Halopelagius fulvigenes TaxID=1198324 RepID=A0ABD5TZ82_9EURY